MSSPDPRPSPVRLSVVMPVRNALPYLRHSIVSILDQTYDAFEFVILDDASDDGTYEELLSWEKRDERIRVATSSTRLGLARSSNRVVGESRGAVIARMDADDVCHPDRLRRQMRVFDNHPDVVLVGCLAEGIDRSGRKVHPRDISRAFRRSPYSAFPHGSAMFRRDVFDATGGYRSDCEGWEDLDLFLRLHGKGDVVIITDPLYSYRYHSDGWTLSTSDVRMRSFVMEARCMSAYRRGHGYDDILDRPPAEPQPEDLLRAYTYQSSVSIWSGSRPPPISSVGVSPLAAGARVFAHALVNTTAGRLAPVGLRAVLAAGVRLKDRLARTRWGDRDEVLWDTGF